MSPAAFAADASPSPASGLTIQGRAVPADLVGELTATPANSDAETLRQKLDEDGYLLLRGTHDRDAVRAARAEVLTRLAEVDEIGEPADQGVATGRSNRAEMHADLGAFWRSVSEGPALRRVVHGDPIRAIASRLFGETAAPFSFVWLRAMTPGRASPLHVDHPYMNRGSDRLVTVWTPLGAVGLDEGPLFIMEGSHRFSDIRTRFEGLDVDRDKSRPGHIEDHPIDLAEARGARLLTTAFEPGDCLIFGMFTVHAAFDNGARSGRVRVSCDTRFQPGAEPMDERFSGDNPPAHEGKGYGCLAASRPLTAAMARR